MLSDGEDGTLGKGREQEHNDGGFMPWVHISSQVQSASRTRH